METRNIFCIFLSLSHLKIEGNVEIPLHSYLSLTNNPDHASKWNKTNNDLESIYGKVALDGLLQHPYFHALARGDVKEQKHYSVLFESHVMKYLDTLWLVKDHSININGIIFQGGDTSGYRSGIESMTTCTGTYKDVTFTGNELLNGVDLYNKITAIDNKNNPHIDGVNGTNYNDLTRISRSFLFVEGSRHIMHMAPKLTFMIAALEAMFSISHINARANVSNRAARYIAKDDSECNYLVKFLKKMYDFRSEFIHGNRLTSIKTTTDLAPRMIELDNILRQILLQIITKDSATFIDEIQVKKSLESMYMKS